MAPDAKSVVVYLGASQPVHRTHVHLVRSLLDAGHDRVFVFLLRWRPERFGTSADAAADTLREWLAKLSPADQARLHLEVVQHDHLGATCMRAVLGGSADPDVEVCFSRKYDHDKHRERIKTDWLPLYACQFPKARPRFLSDDTDPGGDTAAGTGAFVAALKELRDAATESAVKKARENLKTWRPESELETSWNSYVDGLLQGRNREPFYTANDKKLLEDQFFSDNEVLEKLGVSCAGRFSLRLGEYLKDSKNKMMFWKKEAGVYEEALWKRFCLKQQLGSAAPQWTCKDDLKEFSTYFETSCLKPKRQMARKNSKIPMSEGALAANLQKKGGPCFVVDCGSGHSKVYTYTRDGKDINSDATRLESVLTDVLVGESSKWGEFFDELETGGLEKDSSAPLFLGATGGVRRALESNQVSMEIWATFTKAMEKRWPNRKVDAVVLNGKEEAARELTAARTLMRAMMDINESDFQQQCPGLLADRVGLLSGGGESCQVAWDDVAGSHVESLRISTVEAVKKIENDENQGWSFWEDTLIQVSSQILSLCPQGKLKGVFVGTTLQADAAKQCGCAGRFVSHSEIAKALAELVLDLKAPIEPERVQKMHADYKAWADKKKVKQPWASRKLINLLSARRLLVILQQMFSSEAIFFFTRGFEIKAGHLVDIEWTLGSFLSM